jgi:drug/metabolite transporter (DMT)-like permease
MLELVIGAIIISFSAVFVKLTTVEPTVSAFYRMFFGALVLSAIVLIKREPIWFGWWTASVIIFAALCFAGDLFFWHRSILFIGPGLATLLANFQVFLLALAGLLWFRDPLRWETVFSIPLAIIGLGLLIGTDWFSLPGDYRTGIVFGLLTAFCYAAYILSLRASRVSETGSSSLGIMALISFYCALILVVLAGLEGQSLAIPSWQDTGMLIAYGIVAQVLGWMMISRGITKVGAAQTGLILLLQPTFSFVWDVAFFARRFTLFEACGAMLALTAIYLGSLRR